MFDLTNHNGTKEREMKILALYKKGERNFTNANLRGADLRGADLSGADLREADLSGADLSEADLSGADLSGADLSEARLERASLREACLQGADLTGADLQEADLRAANLEGVEGIPQAPKNLLITLWEYTKTRFYDQSSWCNCLAGKTAKLIGLPGNSGTGVIAIHREYPEFNLSVLYRSDENMVIVELKKVANLRGIILD